MFLTTPSKDIKINEFLSPFATECWYLTIFLILLGSFSFGILLIKEDIPNQVERYTDSFLIPIGSLCQQGVQAKYKLKYRIVSFSIGQYRIVQDSIIKYRIVSFSIGQYRIVSFSIGQYHKVSDSIGQYHLVLVQYWYSIQYRITNQMTC